ncbi:MAG: hypothetical protein P1U32_05820 [Legionellaceae bacterium]|nr:hypothetical protein [Legionellaceae bacterium]
MKTFEDIQRGLIQVILDYHASKNNLVMRPTPEGKDDEDTDDEIMKDDEVEDNLQAPHQNTWTKVTSRLSQTPEPSPLETLLGCEAERRNREIDTYISEATAHTQTRRELLISLKEIISLLDIAKNIQPTDEPETYTSTLTELTKQLVALQQNIPRSGDAHTALNTFFSAIGHLHITLTIALTEHMRTAQATIVEEKNQLIKEQVEKIRHLEDKREELSFQNRAFQQMISRQYPQEPTAAGPRLTGTDQMPARTGGLMGQFRDWLATHSGNDSDEGTHFTHHPGDYL